MLLSLSWLFYYLVFLLTYLELQLFVDFCPYLLKYPKLIYFCQTEGQRKYPVIECSQCTFGKGKLEKATATFIPPSSFADLHKIHSTAFHLFI